jgi:hypothetical protein
LSSPATVTAAITEAANVIAAALVHLMLRFTICLLALSDAM